MSHDPPVATRDPTAIALAPARHSKRPAINPTPSARRLGRSQISSRAPCE
jgi:hypothetical protein